MIVLNNVFKIKKNKLFFRLSFSVLYGAYRRTMFLNILMLDRIENIEEIKMNLIIKFNDVLPMRMLTTIRPLAKRINQTQHRYMDGAIEGVVERRLRCGRRSIDCGNF